MPGFPALAGGSGQLKRGRSCRASRAGTAAARIGVAVGLTLLLGGCNALTRLAEVGAEPPLTAIENPTRQPNYRPVTMPMPSPNRASLNANSLWRTGARAFFKDQRASDIGDILTVVIQVDASASIENTTDRSRIAAEDAALSNFLGLEDRLNQVFPEAFRPDRLVDGDSKGSHKGKGTITREEVIELKVAAVVSQILPNGNMVIHGRQEVRVNFEVRELQIAGIIRPEDISSTNSISSEKIAEARISYGGWRDEMTKQTRRRFSPEYKEQSVARLSQPGATHSSVAAELGVTPTQLKTWRLELEAAGSAAATAAQKAEAAELVQLRRDNKRLTEEVEVLRKASAFFAQWAAKT